MEMHVVADVVGRERELGEVARFLASLEVAPGALILEGDAGIGKTTLWRSAVAEARHRSWHVLACRASESESALSFVALADLFEDVGEAALEVLAEPQRRALDAATLRVAAPPDRVALARAGLNVVRTLAAEAPVVLAVDDLQWLDAPSADALRFIVRRLGDARVGVVASLRRPARLSLELDRAFAPSRLTVLEVTPIGLRELERLVRSQRHIRLTRPEWSALHRISGGNPLFAIQLADALAERGALGPGEALPVPVTLAEAVEERLRLLPAATRSALLNVAALAQPTVSLVTSEKLADAIEAGIVVVDGERLRFTHPVYGSVVYATAAVEERRAAHRRLARLVTDQDEAALHLARGTVQVDEEVASALETAAARAATHGHLESASELALHAERLTPIAESEVAGRRGLAAAVYLYGAGDGRRSRAVLERLVRVLPVGPLRARTLRVFGWVHDHVDESAALLEQALAEADIEDDALRSEIHYQLCRTMAFQDDWQSSAEHAQAAVDHAERAGDAAALARAIGRAAVIPTMRGRGAALAPIDRALALERSLSTPLRLSESPSTMRGIVLLGEERFGEARDVLDEAYQRALALGDMWRAILLTWLTELEVRAGNWERAAEHALEAEELGGQWGVADGEAWGLYARGLVEAHRGNVAPSRAALDQACALAHSIGNVWVSLRIEAALAFLDLSVGDASAVRRRMQPLLERDAVPARALVDMVEALVVLGDVEQASAVASRLAQRLAEAPLPSLVAGEARSRALSHAAAGDLSAAQTAVAQGLATENRFEEPFERARTLLVAGTIYRRIKRKAEARDALERARDAFERLGATLWVEKVRAELARTGAQRSGSGLTSTERRVAELAARGATNREISGELFMSVKTVEANLSRVYAKLGIRSRTQLASHADAIEGTA